MAKTDNQIQKQVYLEKEFFKEVEKIMEKEKSSFNRIAQFALEAWVKEYKTTKN